MHISRNTLSFLTIFFFLGFFVSCNKDCYSVGIELFDEQFSQLQSKTFPVYSQQQVLERVQTNNLSNVQLGYFSNEYFGEANSGFISQLDISSLINFGNYTQNQENKGDLNDVRIINENEQLTSVYLDLPFFNNVTDTDNDGVIDLYDVDPFDSNSDSDNDGLSDIVERDAGTDPLSSDSDNDGILDPEDQDNSSYDSSVQLYEVDSVFGNRSAKFDLKVYDLKYFLSSLDPSNNFESSKEYFSDDNFYQQGYSERVLHNGRVGLDFDVIPVNYYEDDPETEIDELTEVNYYETPRLRIPLDIEFFQRYIVNLEGSDNLANQANFNNYFKGLIVKAENFSDNLYMLLDVANAKVTMEYTYDFYNINDTFDDISDDEVEKKRSLASIPLGGVYFNVYDFDNLNSSILTSAINGDESISSDKIYVNGSKFISKLKLFSNDKTISSELANFKAKDILINEANLVLYLDNNIHRNNDEFLPDRLYLYSFENGETIQDYNKDFSIDFTTNKPNRDKFVLGGFLQYDSNNIPVSYKFNITNHVSNIIRYDSLNIDLGLTVTNDIDDISIKTAYLSGVTGDKINIPTPSISIPFPIALYGPEPSPENISKKLKLEILYTEY